MAKNGSASEHLILDGKLCNGIQSVSFEILPVETSQSLIGGDESKFIATSSPRITAKVNKLLLNQDFITGLKDFKDSQGQATGFSGMLIYGDQNMSFRSGVLDGFSVTASTNDIPEISYDFTIYDALTGFSLSYMDEGDPFNDNDVRIFGNVTVPLSQASADSPKDIIPITGVNVTFDKTGIATGIGGLNVIESFSYTETYSYDVQYGIGVTGAPISIKMIDPIVQTASITIQAEDYVFEDNYRAFTSNNVTNRNIALEINGTGGSVNAFELSGASLINESISTQVGEVVSATLQYKGHKRVND